MGEPFRVGVCPCKAGRAAIRATMSGRSLVLRDAVGTAHRAAAVEPPQVEAGPGDRVEQHRLVFAGQAGRGIRLAGLEVARGGHDPGTAGRAIDGVAEEDRAVQGASIRASRPARPGLSPMSSVSMADPLPFQADGIPLAQATAC